MNEAQVKKVFEDKEFVKSLLAIETPEAAQKALKAKGFDVTLDDVKDLGKSLSEAARGAIGKDVSDEDLEKVAGGLQLQKLMQIVEEKRQPVLIHPSDVETVTDVTTRW
jgi:predicted ribosomally synthesized peptide with nif11-like leader